MDRLVGTAAQSPASTCASSSLRPCWRARAHTDSKRPSQLFKGSHTTGRLRREIRGIAATTGEGTSAYQQREAGLKIQLEDLKREAQETQAMLLQAARQAASTAGRGDNGDDDAAPMRERLESAIVAMSEGLIERDTEVRLLLLAALSREHVLYIGPPGTAKSELGRRLSRLCHGRYFERLLTRFSVPEELFGPLSMRALEEDRYVRQTDGYLPQATVAFVDEVFKANSAILNTLLTILNERLFDNGADRVRVPLLCLVGASNELPESEELDALYDRFLIRRQVSQVSPAGLLEMLSTSSGRRQVATLGRPGEISSDGDGEVPLEPLLEQDDFENTRARAEQAVEVPASVLNIIADLRSFLQDKCEPPVYVSDRRLVKAVALMQVAAYTSGHRRLAPHHCLLLRHVLWQRPEEANRIYDWLLEALAADDGMQQMQYLLAGMFGRACRSLNEPGAATAVSEEVTQLRETLADKLAEVYASTSGGILSVGEGLWLGKDEADAVASALLPRMEKTRDEVEKLLFEVVTLEVALRQGTEAVVLAELMPRHWSDFVRNAPMEQVRPLGTQQQQPPKKSP